MLNVSWILVSGRRSRLALAVSVVALLVGCGQKGPLFLPSGSATAGRATLPQTLVPAASTATPTASAAGGGATPGARP